MTRYLNDIRLRIAAVIIAAVLLIATTLGSLALLTDTLPFEATVPLAKVSITGNDLEAVSHEYAAIFPGTDYNSPFAIEISNDGNQNLRYAFSTTSFTPNGTSWDDIFLHIYSVSSAAACTPTTTDTLIVPANIKTAAFGNPLAGQQPSDRTLAAGASEWLCFRANAPASNTSDITTSAVANYRFSAEQTINNP